MNESTLTALLDASVPGWRGAPLVSGQHEIRAPYREDKRPSLHIHPEKLSWIDRGTGEGGGAFALACRVLGRDRAMELLNELEPKEPGQVHKISEARGADRDIVAEYDYCNEQGELVYQVQRTRVKKFIQRKPDGEGGWTYKLGDTKPLLYRLPDVVKAVAAGDTIYLVEGEKSVHALEAAGAVATTISGGALTGSREFPEHLAGFFRDADVCIVRDNDSPGHEHARKCWAAIQTLAKTVRVAESRTGGEKHDVVEHLEAGYTLSQLRQVWPKPTRETDPAGWQAEILRSCLNIDPSERTSYAKTFREAMAEPDLPRWPTGLLGGAEYLPDCQGVTIVCGGPSAAKSYFSIGSSLAAAEYSGWEVLYMVAEMGAKHVAERASARLGGAEPPPNWRMVMSEIGDSLDKATETLCSMLTGRKTLIVIDSLSSFIDNDIAMKAGSGDVFGMGPLKRAVMWALTAKRRSQGLLSFLLLSELNSQGFTKGKFADHKADLVISMKTDENDDLLKHIRVVKGWKYRTGLVGSYDLDWENAKLTYAGKSDE